MFPLLIVGLGALIGYLSSESDAMKAFSETSPHPDEDITGAQLLGMMCGIFLTLFVMMYGSMIFNKVKAEKTNRIVEIIASCVPGRTVMFAKVISVGLVGVTQMLIWTALLAGTAITLLMIFPTGFDLTLLLDPRVLRALAYAILYFTGGFAFFGGLFAVAGAVTDRNNENQGYLSIIMMILMVSFYLGMFAVDNTGALSTVCFYLPFTSPSVGAVQSIAGTCPWYLSLLSLSVLYASAGVVLIFAGKVYTSAILLKGKRLSPADIITFLKAK